MTQSHPKIQHSTILVRENLGVSDAIELIVHPTINGTHSYYDLSVITNIENTPMQPND
jgi:hypothetical protein